MLILTYLKSSKISGFWFNFWVCCNLWENGAGSIPFSFSQFSIFLGLPSSLPLPSGCELDSCSLEVIVLSMVFPLRRVVIELAFSVWVSLEQETLHLVDGLGWGWAGNLSFF